MKVFIVKDPLPPHMTLMTRRIEAENEEDAVRQVAEEFADERGEPDWAFAKSFIYEEA